MKYMWWWNILLDSCGDKCILPLRLFLYHTLLYLLVSSRFLFVLHIFRFSTSSGMVLDDPAKFPPSFRMSRSGYTFPTARPGLRLRHRPNTRPRLLHAFKRGASVIKASMPKIKDVNIIDKYSRVVFPVSFLMFNLGYWVFYVVWGSAESPADI